MKTLILLCVCLLSEVVLIAQNGLSSINLPAAYTAAQMRYRSGIASDSSGNLWVAFQYKGLAKYDGSSWTLYTASNSLLLSDTVLCIFTYNNNVYAGTVKGLSCYNGIGWTNWDMSDGLAGDEINGIYCDGQGLIVASQTHISIQNGAAWTNVMIPGSDHSVNGYYNFQYYHSALFKDASGNIWVGRRDAGLLKYNGSSWETLTYMGNSISQPRAIERDAQGRIWVGGASVYIFNGSYFVNPDQLYPDWNGYMPGGVNAFAKSPQGEIFFTGGYLYSYLLNASLNTLQVTFPKSYYSISCYHNGTYKMISLNSDTAKVYAFDYSMHNDYGNIYKPDAYKYLDGNLVKAGYGNRGMMFWDLVGNPSYEVPKGSGKHSIFCGGIWLGGYNDDDSLCVAMENYGQGGHDFFPGPLRSTGLGMGTTDTASCLKYDRIWKINKWEIDSFRSWYADGSLGTGNHTIPEAIATWPAHGDDGDGFSYFMAPFVDTDTNGLYEPDHGDYPRIRGTQMLWWVYNDALAPHAESGGKPMGVEIRASAYVYGCDTFSGNSNAVNYTLFMHYEIYNRTTYNYHDCFAGFWTDADLGDHADDYIGCDVGLNSFFVYNGDESDGDGNGKTYGLNPPCQSVVILRGPLAPELDGIDNDRNGFVDESFESTGMSRFVYFNNNSSSTGNPQTAEDCYNYMRGFWRDGTPMTYGGTGYQSSGTHCNFMFPGNSDPSGFGTGGIPQIPWTEESENNPAGDRRGLAGMGPFTWQPGGLQVLDIAFIWSRDSSGAYSSVLKNFAETEQIVEFYRKDSIWSWITGGQFPYCDNAPAFSEQVVLPEDKIQAYPNPASATVNLVPSPGTGRYSLELINLNGKTIMKKDAEGLSQVDVSEVPRGIYIIRMVCNKKTESLKLVVQ